MNKALETEVEREEKYREVEVGRRERESEITQVFFGIAEVWTPKSVADFASRHLTKMLFANSSALVFVFTNACVAWWRASNEEVMKYARGVVVSGNGVVQNATRPGYALNCLCQGG